MISKADNERLTRVGPGTAMGAMLRRYWHPIAASRDLRERATTAVRLLGEDFVLFRDREGRLGLLAARCPHRGASLAYGVPTCEGIRCPYHGWEFNRAGKCVSQPNEPNGGSGNRITTAGYLAQELGGLIFGYIGPLPAPLLPPYDLLVWTNAQKVIRRALVPCNWLQIVENSLDPAHLEWLHGHYSNDIAALAGASPPLEVRHHTKLGFDVFDGGIVKRRLLEGQTTADEDWMIGQQLIFPACFRVGTSGRCSFQFRVPVDDTSTWVFWYECVLAQDNGVTALDDVAVVDIDYLDENGDFRLDTIDGQDIMAWVTAGEIADRSVERLGKADEGIILYRKLLREQLRSVEQGYDPIGVLRQDPSGGIIAMPLRTMALPVTERADADAEWAPLPCD